MYLIQYYVIKFVSKLEAVSCFFQVHVLWFSQLIKVTTKMNEILLKVVLNNTTHPTLTVMKIVISRLYTKINTSN